MKRTLGQEIAFKLAQEHHYEQRATTWLGKLVYDEKLSEAKYKHYLDFIKKISEFAGEDRKEIKGEEKLREKQEREDFLNIFNEIDTYINRLYVSRRVYSHKVSVSDWDDNGFKQTICYGTDLSDEKSTSKIKDYLRQNVKLQILVPADSGKLEKNLYSALERTIGQNFEAICQLASKMKQKETYKAKLSFIPNAVDLKKFIKNITYSLLLKGLLQEERASRNCKLSYIFDKQTFVNPFDLLAKVYEKMGELNSRPTLGSQ